MKVSKRIFVVFIILILVTALLFLMTTATLGGPGGIIAKAVAKTWIGKLILFILFVVFFPLIAWVMIKEARAVARARKALEELGRMNNSFRWSILKERAYAIITQVYSAWGKQDLERAVEWMTPWFWQNQKLTVLEDWEEAGLRNQCRLKKIKELKPFYVEYCENEPGDGEGSRIVLSVGVNLQDYLEETATGKIVEGDKKFKDLDTLWTLHLTDGAWRLTLIEDSNLSLVYAKLRNDLEAARAHLEAGLKYKGARE